MADQPTKNLSITNASIAVETQGIRRSTKSLQREHERQITLAGTTGDKQHPNPIIVALYESDQDAELDAGQLSDGSWCANIYLPPAAFDPFWQIALVRRSIDIRISLRLDDTGQPTNILFLALGDPWTRNPSPAELQKQKLNQAASRPEGGTVLYSARLLCRRAPPGPWRLSALRVTIDWRERPRPHRPCQDRSFVSGRGQPSNQYTPTQKSKCGTRAWRSVKDPRSPQFSRHPSAALQGAEKIGSPAACFAAALRAVPDLPEHRVPDEGGHQEDDGFKRWRSTCRTGSTLSPNSSSSSPDA